MTTQEMMKIALDLAGLEEQPADTVIQVEGENIKRVLAGIDVGTAEIAVAHSMGFDCIVRHHPSDPCMANVGYMERDSHVAHMVEFGVPLPIAQKVWEGRPQLTFQSTHVINYGANPQLAKFLGIAAMSIHTPADLLVQRFVQERVDKLGAENPKLTLGEIVDSLMEVKEFNSTPQHPGIWVGHEGSYAGKVMVSMAGGCGPTLEEYQACINAGVNTFVVMHLKKEIQDVLAAEKRCNVIVAGHMASDSYGFNRILDKWEECGLEVVRIGGIIS